MGSELEVLKKIWENKKETSVKLISGQTGLGLDYIRYLCNCLIKRRRIRSVRKKPGWYRITAKGKKELKLLGIFKLKILKENKGIKKVVLPWPKELLKKRLPKGKPRSRNFVSLRGKEIPVDPVTTPTTVSNKSLIRRRQPPTGSSPSTIDMLTTSCNGVEEKKLRLGKMIEKTISFLRALSFSAKPRTTFRENNTTKQTTQKVVRGKGRKRRKGGKRGSANWRRKKYVKR